MPAEGRRPRGDQGGERHPRWGDGGSIGIARDGDDSLRTFGGRKEYLAQERRENDVLVRGREREKLVTEGEGK